MDSQTIMGKFPISEYFLTLTITTMKPKPKVKEFLKSREERKALNLKKRKIERKESKSFLKGKLFY